MSIKSTEHYIQWKNITQNWIEQSMFFLTDYREQLIIEIIVANKELNICK